MLFSQQVSKQLSHSRMGVKAAAWPGITGASGPLSSAGGRLVGVWRLPRKALPSAPAARDAAICYAKQARDSRYWLWWCPAGDRRRPDKSLQTPRRRSSSRGWSAAAAWTFWLWFQPEDNKNTHEHAQRRRSLNTKTIWLQCWTHKKMCASEKLRVTWSSDAPCGVGICPCSPPDLSPTYLQRPVTQLLGSRPVRRSLVSGWKQSKSERSLLLILLSSLEMLKMQHKCINNNQRRTKTVVFLTMQFDSI